MATSPTSPIARFFLIFTDFTKVIVNDPSVNTAGSNRWFIWLKVIELIKERPIFGIGISNLELIFASRFRENVYQVFGVYTNVDKAHNEYLDIAVSSGIPSLVSYLFFLFTVTLNKIKESDFVSDINLPIICAVSGYAAQAFFNISVVSVAFLFWILLGLLVQNTKIVKQ
jgi:putative inorganic carbon (HCO3(-)) transporter